MKRPYVPLDVRLKVLERQAFVDRQFETKDDRELALEWYAICCRNKSDAGKIKYLLQVLFFTEVAELDHDPALVLRKRTRTGKYKPDANDPRYLVYRTDSKHLQKTTGRAPGAERTVTAKGSDVWLAKKYRKLVQPKESKSRLQSRPFPKAKRPLRSRSSFATRAGKDSSRG